MPYFGAKPADAAVNTLAHTTTIGDGSAADALIKFDGNAQDFHIGLDDTADDLVIGLGSALGTTTHMSFDEAGIVSMPLQPFASTHLDGNQTIANTTATKVSFALEISDINADFGSNKFTCPVDGVYLVKAQASALFADTKGLVNHIYVNGAEVNRMQQTSPLSSSRLYGQMVHIMECDASDYIEIFVYQDSGGNLDFAGASSPSYTNFQVAKIA
jgi:hypothetical protein